MNINIHTSINNISLHSDSTQTRLQSQVQNNSNETRLQSAKVVNKVSKPVAWLTSVVLLLSSGGALAYQSTKVSPQEQKKMEQLVKQNTSLPADIANAVVAVESEHDEGAESHVGALGLTQIMPDTAKKNCKGLNINNSSHNVQCGSKVYLLYRGLIQKWLKKANLPTPNKNSAWLQELTIIAYNSGIGTAKDLIGRAKHHFRKEKIVPTGSEIIEYMLLGAPRETRNYLPKFRKALQHYRK